MNAALEKAPHLRIENFNKRHEAYSRKYGTAWSLDLCGEKKILLIVLRVR